MRKFKVKNRRKRKYVKKHDLASSLSLTHTLTIGMLPALLIAIPFIATYLVYNFTIPSVALPQMPEIVFHFTLPSLPQINLPQMTLPAAPEMPEVSAPTVPTITVPDYTQVIVTMYRNVITTISTLGAQTVMATGQLLSLLDPRPFLLITVQAISTTVEHTIVTTEAEWTATGELMVQLGMLSSNALISLWGIVYAWLHWLGTAIINGWNAFVWFIGTPFRALDASAKELQQASSPVGSFFEDSFRVALNEFTSGFNTLTGSTAK